MLRKILLFLFPFFILFSVHGQINKPLRKTVDEMVKQDQEIRDVLNNLYDTYYKTENRNNLRSKRYKAVQPRFLEHDSLETEYQFKFDSISNIMSKIDQSNRIKLEEILKKYGYPGKKTVGHYDADLILLHSSFQWIRDKFPLLKEEVKKGNLRAITLANSYDKFSNIEGLGFLYHTLLLVDESNKLSQTIPSDLEKTNKARKEIGLKPIRIKKNGKRKK